MVNPNKIREEITPVVLESPSLETIVKKARQQGMIVGGTFPLEAEKRYAVLFFDLNPAITQQDLIVALEANENIANAYYVGEHTTGTNLPYHQWRVDLKIKVSEEAVPVDPVMEEPSE
jgi:hypothetical protein